MSDTTDAKLLEQFARSQSEPAFAELVERHLGLVYSTAFRKTDSPQHAEEITQAVFIILARKAGSLGPKTVLPGWLYHTARLTAANFQRAEMRRVRREQEAFMQSTSNESAPDTLWREMSPLLEDAMAGLGAGDRDAIVLRFFQNRSMAEVGKALGANEDAARMRVNRALEKLRKFFNKRGVVSTTATISGTISSNSVHHVPAGLAKTISTVALAKGAAASTSTLTLVKGALKIMAWTKAKMAIITGIAVLFVVGTTSIVIVQKESLIDGKTEREWIAGIVYRGDDNQVRVWHSLGPKGLQMLLRAMKPSPAVLTYENALGQHRTVDGLVLKEGVAGIGTQMNAGFLLGQLADSYDVSDAIPTVIKLLKTEKDDDVRALELGFFEIPIQTMSEKEKATLLPELVRALNDIGSSSVLAPYDEYANSLSDVRNNALGLLPYYQNQKETMVPLIINAMKDPNPLVRLRAVDVLNKMDPQNAASSEFVPVLIGCLTSPMGVNFTAVNESALMLGELHRDPDMAVPALIQALQRTNNYNLANVVRANAAWALGRFGGRAGAAVPALQQALEDSDALTRRQAAAALRQINSNSPAR